MLRSIRSRLTLWYTLVVAVIFVVIATVTYQYVSATLYDQLDLALSNEARWIAQRLAKQRAEGEQDASVVESLGEHGAYYPAKLYFEVWTPGGRLLCQSTNIFGDSLVKHVPLANRPIQAPGCSSRTQWASMPQNPMAFTPARRGAPPAGRIQGRVSVLM